jgi:lysophospholipase L1-like esterase
VRIDLFNSPLRHADAPLRDQAEMRRMLDHDARYRQQLRDLDDAQRTARMDVDARTLAELPRWFLRPDIRGFDPVHPNRAGHRAIALLACPQLPASWGCHCPAQ